MSSDHTRETEKHESNTIEDLTLEETKTDNVKGGVRESFGFGVEREMKESGEK